MDRNKKGSKEKKGVVNLSDYRKDKSEKRMRDYERILFNRILGVYSFAEKGQLHHVEIVDVSYSGVKFREMGNGKPFQVGDKLALRFYFTPSSYLRVIMQVKRAAPIEEDGKEGLEYGCSLDKQTRAYEVIRQLISFMHKYTETACQDENPPMIWF